MDLVGRLPTVQELMQYQNDPPATRKSKLLDRLLDSEAYQNDYATNWMTIYTNLMIGRPMARENRTLFNREGMQQYFRTSFARNKPYDQMVYELVSATGTTKPGQEGYNGAVNFLIGKLQENATSFIVLRRRSGGNWNRKASRVQKRKTLRMSPPTFRAEQLLLNCCPQLLQSSSRCIPMRKSFTLIRCRLIRNF